MQTYRFTDDQAGLIAGREHIDYRIGKRITAAECKLLLLETAVFGNIREAWRFTRIRRSTALSYASMLIESEPDRAQNHHAYISRKAGIFFHPTRYTGRTRSS